MGSLAQTASPPFCMGGLAPLLIAGLAAVWALPAEEPYRVAVDVRNVLLAVTVSHDDGGFAEDLEATDFTILDNGRRQEIVSFSAGERPAAVGLVIDNSGSMSDRRIEVTAAAMAFVTASNPEDDFFVVHFNDLVRLGLPGDVDFTGASPELRTALWQLRPEGQTALYDAISVALDHLRQSRLDRQALLVLSDGGDTASEILFPDLLDKARQVGAVIYALGIYGPDDMDRNPGQLRRLARATGGAAYFPKTSKEATELCRRIGEEMRKQYLMSFRPAMTGHSDSFHRVRVLLSGERSKGLHLRTRDGYVEP